MKIHAHHRRRALDRAAARRPGPGPGACDREVLRHRQGRQERLPDRDLVLRRHVQEGRADRRLAQRAQGHVREDRRRLAHLDQELTPSAAASGNPSRRSTRPVQPALPGRRPNQPRGFRHDFAHSRTAGLRHEPHRPHRRAAQQGARFPLSLLEFGMRLAVGATFFRSGMNKVEELRQRHRPVPRRVSPAAAAAGDRGLHGHDGRAQRRRCCWCWASLPAWAPRRCWS